MVEPINSDELNPNKLYGIDVVQYKFKKDCLAKEDQRYNKVVIGFIAEDIYEKYPIAADYSVDEERRLAKSEQEIEGLKPNK